MGKLRVFWRVLKGTFTSREYYKDILKAPFSFSLKFFYFFFFLYSIVFTSYLIIKFVIPAGKVVKVLPSKLEKYYPSELIIKIDNGEVSTNVQEPYLIPMSQVKNFIDELRQDVKGRNTQDLENLLVIDTNGSIDNFNSYSTLALLTKNNFSFINDDGNIETISLGDFDNITINQALVSNLLGKIEPWLRFIVPGLSVIIFISVLLFMPSFELSYLLFFAVVLLVISKLMKANLSYKKAYQIGMHLVVVATVVWSILLAVGFSVTFPFARTVILAILAVLILSKIKLSPQAPQAQTQTAPVS